MNIKDFHFGKLTGIIMDFGQGDILPMHRHGPMDVHISVVARGRFRVHGPEIGDNEYAAGAVIDWPVDVDHEFIGLDADNRLVNIVKG